MSAIGENIKKYRNQKKYTQEYLARIIHGYPELRMKMDM